VSASDLQQHLCLMASVHDRPVSITQTEAGDYGKGLEAGQLNPHSARSAPPQPPNGHTGQCPRLEMTASLASWTSSRGAQSGTPSRTHQAFDNASALPAIPVPGASESASFSRCVSLWVEACDWP
jgi:hypothetical protein